RRAGGVGSIAILNPASMEQPWARVVAQSSHPTLVLGAGLNDLAGQRASVTWNPAHAGKLFEGTSYSWDTLAAVAGQRKPPPRFVLKKRIQIDANVTAKPITSSNVVGLLPGTDKALQNQYIVVSAHLDHLGAHAGASGDSIFNGTIDNASGVATVLE